MPLCLLWHVCIQVVRLDEASKQYGNKEKTGYAKVLWNHDRKWNCSRIFLHAVLHQCVFFGSRRRTYLYDTRRTAAFLIDLLPKCQNRFAVKLLRLSHETHETVSRCLFSWNSWPAAPHHLCKRRCQKAFSCLPEDCSVAQRAPSHTLVQGHIT